MESWKQRTVAKRVSCTGIGLHSGKPATLALAPAAVDSGITFVRSDLGVEIPAVAANVVDTTLCTTLGVGNTRIATVEHVLSALAGLGIDNVRVEVSGPEVPIMDGSAAPFVYLVQSAGIAIQRTGKRFLLLQKTVGVKGQDKEASLGPARELSIDYTIDFDHPLITDQAFRFVFSDRGFDRDVARARTFCLLRDVEKLKSLGLAQGGSLENAIVVDDFSILNPDGLRFPDEFVRHKVLDALGDLALMGMPVIGAFRAVRSGHALNHALVTAVLADESAYKVVRVSDKRELDRLEIRLPGWASADGRVAV
jgi:UDP-3-O-[3-hydroxymyristoyl] N-acetylglucosamine deacetylase